MPLRIFSGFFIVEPLDTHKYTSASVLAVGDADCLRVLALKRNRQQIGAMGDAFGEEGRAASDLEER